MAIRPYIFTKETRFLGGLLRLRNRVSFMPPTDNRNFHHRNPVSEPPPTTHSSAGKKLGLSTSSLLKGDSGGNIWMDKPVSSAASSLAS